jgi:Protein of unknown function (DUF3306)
MSQDFLLRWSRRKRAAAQAAEPPKHPPDAESAAPPEHAAGPDRPESRDASGAALSAPQSCAPAFDPASLPPIESITAESDIRAFLAAGVPAELTRAALRRVWTSDPKIRDYVGLADYDWDFNAPGSMAGFGPLEGADALRAQAARWVGPVTTKDSVAEDGAAEMSDHDPGPERGAPLTDAAFQDLPTPPTQIENEPSQKIGGSREGDEPAQTEREYTAVQHQQSPEDVQSIARRKHGRALPE